MNSWGYHNETQDTMRTVNSNEIIDDNFRRAFLTGILYAK